MSEVCKPRLDRALPKDYRWAMMVDRMQEMGRNLCSIDRLQVVLPNGDFPGGALGRLHPASLSSAHYSGLLKSRHVLVVDSSVHCKDATLSLPEEESPQPQFSIGVKNIHDARRVTRILGCPHQLVFEDNVPLTEVRAFLDWFLAYYQDKRSLLQKEVTLVADGLGPDFIEAFERDVLHLIEQP